MGQAPLLGGGAGGPAPLPKGALGAQRPSLRRALGTRRPTLGVGRCRPFGQMASADLRCRSFVRTSGKFIPDIP